MSTVAHVAIHPSQFPERVRRDLLESLRTRQVNHKFHYDSIKQAQKWLALHQAFSPSRTDADCAATYDLSFAAATQRIDSASVHLIGLGCGGGQKDVRLLHLLKQRGKQVTYTPSDVSVAMVLVARAAALSVIDEQDCHPLVCDLASADDFGPSPIGNGGGNTSNPEEEMSETRHLVSYRDGFLDATLKQQTKTDAARLITFFGMIPNFEPQIILPRLAGLVRPVDYLLFSANLAPGPDYSAGVQRILPLYDNELTRDWLMTFLLDLGVEKTDGELRFMIEDDPAGSGLKRVVANFHFGRARRIQMDEEIFEFCAGESVRLFFSYRQTPKKVSALLEAHGLKVLEQWITKSEEEGVFLCQRAG